MKERKRELEIGLIGCGDLSSGPVTDLPKRAPIGLTTPTHTASHLKLNSPVRVTDSIPGTHSQLNLTATPLLVSSASLAGVGAQTARLLPMNLRFCSGPTTFQSAPHKKTAERNEVTAYLESHPPL